ncbi:MAG: RND family transporter [Brachymonas sp.]
MSDTVTEPKNALERYIAWTARQLIAFRWLLGLAFLLVTLGLGYSLKDLRFDTSFTKFIPQNHPYMSAFLKNFDTFSGANRLMVNVRWKGQGDIFNSEYMDVLHKVTDDVFYLDTQGVNRASVTSLYTPNVFYVEVTEQGFQGEVVIPSNFDVASLDAMDRVRANVQRSGRIGTLVANNVKGSMVQAELMSKTSEGKQIDYLQLADNLEKIRAKYEKEHPNIAIEMVGFTNIVGAVATGIAGENGTKIGLLLQDPKLSQAQKAEQAGKLFAEGLINPLKLGVIGFFISAFLITTILLWIYSRSLKLTLLALLVAMLPVMWLLGILPMLGMGVDPMSILVPFLIFSIGVSHAVQMTNAWKHEVALGRSSKQASENAFRMLAIPGTLALLMNALGFAVIMMIDIPVVHELGVTACLGVSLMIVTNKAILPIILSHLKLEKAARDGNPEKESKHKLWWWVSSFATPKMATAAIIGALLLLGFGTYNARHLLTGDIGSGAPELRSTSRYNQDNDSIVKNYSIGMDVLSVYIDTKVPDQDGAPADACLNWNVMNAVDQFDLRMRNVDGVQSVITTAWIAKIALAANNEGNPRWANLPRESRALGTGVKQSTPDMGFNNENCKTLNMMVFLKDHQASTLKHVMSETAKFVAEYNKANPGLVDPQKGILRFELAGGNAGVAEATNEAVEKAEKQMLGALFLTIIALCFLTFRSWKAVVCIMVPLTIVSIMCNGLMAVLGVGLKVATLPVVALGVGVGVDYGIYLFERIQHEMNDNGSDLRTAIYEAMRQRGTAAVFTAVTMTIGVATWAFSALKFQADMGILLAFMFLVNVLGAIFLLPAMAHFLKVGKQGEAA